MPIKYYCNSCKEPISKEVYNYSMDKYGVALCRTHQQKRTSHPRNSRPKPTDEARKLAKALTKLGWRVELEKYDGYKHIDIAVTEANVNIEVDGPKHYNDPKQALADLQRNFYSFKKGYLTVRIPNCLVRDDETLQMTAKYLSKYMSINDPLSFLKDIDD